MLKSYSVLNRPIGFQPWFYFFIFLAVNLSISYGGFSSVAVLGISVIGLLLPFLIGLWAYRPAKKPEIPLYQLNFFKTIPFWVWITIGALALFLRFYKLTTFSAWPIFDESLYGFTAVQIAHKGVDRLLYFFNDQPFFYIWCLSLIFKPLGPSLFNLWFLPAFFSALWVPLAYWAARTCFSKSFSFFCVLLAALSFWPCFSGRFSQCGVLVLPLEAWALLWLGKCWRSDNDKQGDLFAGLLGLSVGLSFYAAYLYWISAAFLISATMVILFWRRRPLRLALFGLALALPLIPLSVFFFKTGGGVSYFSSQSIINRPESWLKIIQSALNTPQNIFWRGSSDEYWYKPVWGGLVNPILGALAGVGMLESLKNSSQALYRWFCVSFIVFLLPGMLGEGFEFYRVIPVLAVLIPIISLGWARLTQEFSSRWSAAILLLLMSPSLALDFHQLMDIYPHLWDSPAYWSKQIKSINQYRAYNILRSKSLSDGPGLIFSDFVPGYQDQSLNLADDQFNGVNNDRLDWQKAKWAALVINVNYQPFLAKRFGSGKTYWLSKDLNTADGGWMLWVIDITDANRPIFNQWRIASRALNDYIYQYFLKPSPMDDSSFSKVLETFSGIYPLFKNDSFLEAFYWEKKADLFYNAGRLPDAAQSLNHSLQTGCPAAHLFYRLGTLQMIQNDRINARKTFLKAVHAPINFTQSAQFLDLSASGKHSSP
jgi:hypothetical protein